MERRQAAYKLLDLAELLHRWNRAEVRAWTVRTGAKVRGRRRHPPDLRARLHQAEVASHNDYVELGG